MTEATWTHDPSHYPEPLSALSGDVWLAAMGRGIREAARELRAPFGGFETKLHAGGWAYEHDLDPDWEPDPGRLRDAALAISERWERELCPASWKITEALRALRPERGDPAEATADLDRLVELVDEQWRIHFLTVIPVHAAREVLHDAYVEQFGKRDEIEPYRLIEELARELDVAETILELPSAAALERLATTHHGRDVLLALSAYLQRYGGRSRLHELSEPRDAEQPAVVLDTLRLFCEHPHDLPAQRRAKADARDALEAELLAGIESDQRRAAFASLLERVKAAVPLEETHTYHIDYPGLQATREALLGFGRRLVAEGRLDRSADVFALRGSELQAALERPWGDPLQALVSERWAERAHAASSLPEPRLGPAPDAEPELPPMLAKFYGTPRDPSPEQGVVLGTGASSGRAVGTARVVRSPDDFARVAAREILVCPTTTPAWTPLFGSLGGLVTDTGGILCHAAVVAREYALPAVVGAQGATAKVPDGALVELDGDAGEVRVLRADRVP
jgi:phosphohistidine swiveling domain-containing protein